MPHEAVLRIRVAHVSDGTTPVDIDTDRVPRGEVWRITSFAFEDETSAFTEGRVAIARLNVNHWLVEQDSPAATTLYWTNWEYWLGEGEFLRLRATGLTSGDLVNLYVNGVRLVHEHLSSHLDREPAELMETG